MLGPEDPVEPGVRELSLRPAPDFRVRVVDARGVSIAGVDIDQYGLTPGEARAGPEGLSPERARRLLHRRYLTDANGSVRLASFPGEQMLVASRASECSVAWRGPGRGEVELVLAPGFTLGGTLHLPPLDPKRNAGERRLIVEVAEPGEARVLACTRRLEEGPFGPIALPVLHGQRLRLRLEGEPFVPLIESFLCPAPGTHLTFTLAPEVGHDLFFLARDTEGQPIPAAEAACHYDVDGEERVIRKRGLDDGYIIPTGFPTDVVVRAFVTAPGFAGIWTESVSVPEPTVFTHLAVLERAAQLSGRVTRAGAPVQDFVVVAWVPGRSLETRSERHFRGRANGDFELEDVHAGSVAVAAYTTELPLCDPVVVETSRAEPIELALVEAITGTGRVVDLTSGEPLAAVDVRVFMHFGEGGEGERPWGQPVPVDADGRFTLAGFRAGENRVHVRAPGYAERLAVQNARYGEALDFGTIALSRPQVLELRLAGAAPGTYSSYSAESSHPSPLPARAFDASGVVRYEGVGAATRFVLINSRAGPWAKLMLDLVPGRDWTFEYRVAGPRRLTIEIAFDDEHRPSDYAGLLLSYRNWSGVSIDRAVPVPPTGSCVVEGIDAEHVDVSLYGSVILARAQSESDGADELFVALDPSAEPFVLRVVDDDGQPLAGVSAHISELADGSYYDNESTDETGTCRFVGVPPRPLLAHLEHDVHGRAFGLPLDGRAGTAELRLSGGAKLELVCRDGQVPLAGVEARVREAAFGSTLSIVGTTNGAGLLSAPGFAPGVCSLDFEHPACWPATVTVEARVSGAPTEVQLRRRGSLLLALHSAEGLPVQGCALELQPLELEGSVQDWLERELVTSSTGLLTDLRGEVRLDGLPRGSYRWRLALPPESPLEGVLELAPGKTTTVPVILPPK